MSEENTVPVGEQAESAQTDPQENTDGCGTDNSVVRQETEEESNKQLSAEMCYKYEELHSRPSITPDSEIPENFLHLVFRKAAEKAEQARAKIDKRKQEWAKLYAEKPNKNCEDPQDVEAIHEAKENIGDLKLKSAPDFTVPKHLRVNAERKRTELIDLEENIREMQTEMNGRIVALRDSKVRLVSQLRAQAQQLQKVQQRLAAHLCHPPPALPTVLPEETPEKRLRYSRATLDRYQVLREQRFQTMVQEEQEGGTHVLEQLAKEMEGEEGKEEEEQERGEGRTPSLSASSVAREEEETGVEGGAELSELEEELQREEELRLLHKQDSLLEQMESSVRQFDAELLLLRDRKLRLDWQLKLADLRQLTLYQELMLLKEFERMEDGLQEKFNGCINEENSITGKLEECNEQLELKRGNVAKLQERATALMAAFQASLGEGSRFAEFLTRVFKKKVRRVKKKVQAGNEEEEEESDEDSDEDDDYDCGTEEGGAPVDYNVCPAVLSVPFAPLPHSPFLHQIEFVTNGSVPSDLSSALVLDPAEVSRLQERIKQLQAEKSQQRDLYCQARQQHARLISERKDKAAKVQVLEEQCNQLMMKKYGRLVDLEALQTLSGNRTLEERRQEKLLREAAYAKEIKQCDLKVEEARQALMEVTRYNTECLLSMTSLLDQKKELEHKLNSKQKKMGRQYKDYRRRADQEEIGRLQEVVKTQSQQAEALRSEIGLLSRKGGCSLPPGQAPLPPLAPLPTPTNCTHTSKQGPGRLSKQLKAQNSPTRRGAK